MEMCHRGDVHQMIISKYMGAREKELLSYIQYFIEKYSY
jgi:hypothetical protein